MGESQGEGGGAAVVDDDVAFGRRAEVHEGGGPLVLGVEPVEIDRDAVADPVEGADPALGVVGTIARTVAILREFPGQGVIFEPSTARVLWPFASVPSGPWARLSACRRRNASSSSFSRVAPAVDAAAGSRSPLSGVP